MKLILTEEDFYNKLNDTGIDIINYMEQNLLVYSNKLKQEKVFYKYVYNVQEKYLRQMDLTMEKLMQKYPQPDTVDLIELGKYKRKLYQKAKEINRYIIEGEIV